MTSRISPRPRRFVPDAPQIGLQARVRPSMTLPIFSAFSHMSRMTPTGTLADTPCGGAPLLTALRAPTDHVNATPTSADRMKETA